jgi:hypothetical protein
LPSRGKVGAAIDGAAIDGVRDTRTRAEGWLELEIGLETEPEPLRFTSR